MRREVGLGIAYWAAMTISTQRHISSRARPDGAAAATETDWPLEVYHLLKQAGVAAASYVPDAGHSRLIALLEDDPEVEATVLTTEEEGIAIAAGAWLGGRRSAILMQSSGVGNCINMLSLPVISRCPLLMLVTMRGEWAEFNPWQVPMGQATEATLRAVGVRCFRVETPDDLLSTLKAALVEAFDGDQQIAILIGQRMLGEKKW
jgi:sulfopyruvate decarboxylase alpha subunit